MTCSGSHLYKFYRYHIVIEIFFLYKLFSTHHILYLILYIYCPVLKYNAFKGSKFVPKYKAS
jgi:hypothetical protein